MKLSCEQKDLQSALSLVQKAINPQNTLPILGNVLLKAEGQKLYLSATNLETAITTSFSAAVENEGEITVPAKIFSSYVGFLPNEKIALTLLDGETVSLETKNSKTKIKGISSEEFPAIPSVEKEVKFSLPREELKKAIDQVAFCCATSTTRPVLSGVYFWGREKDLRLVATDSYRLGEKKMVLSKPLEKELKSIVPSRAMQELEKILASSEEKTAEITFSENQILCEIGKTRLISRLIEGKFPEYSQIIPKTSKTGAECAVEELVLGTKRVGLFARENNNNVRLSFTPKGIGITTDATEIGTEESQMDAVVQGEECSIALNGQYFLDILQCLEGEKAQIEVEGKLSPVVVKPKDTKGFVHVIMPLKA